MKHLKRTMVLFLALIMTITILPAAVQAASKKTVYVVSSVKVEENGKTTAIKLSYNEKGLLTKITSTYADEKTTETFSYNKKYQLTKYVKKVISGEHKGVNETLTYTYNGKGQRTSKASEDYKETYKYNTKNQITTAVSERGETNYKYKNGHVKKATGTDPLTYSATFDDHNNIKQWSNKFNTEKIGYGSYTFTYYKNGRAKTLKKTFKPNPMGTEKTQTLTFTYTKMTVPADQADTIADQQWQFINGDGVVGFAW